MENETVEQTEVSVQPANAEKDEGTAENTAQLGKFKSVQSLLEAYNSLQSEFTKRCQRLKELEGKAQTDKTEVPCAEGGKPETFKQGISEEERKEILKDYLKEVLGSKQKAVILDNAGVGVKAPVDRPKSIAEAGRLAKDFL